MTDKSYPVNIKDIGHENLFYDIEGLSPGSIEKNYAQQEDLFHIGYSQLLLTRDVDKLGEYPCKFLFLFITTQLFRGANFREVIQSTLDQAINKLAEKSGIKIPNDLKIYTHPESVKRLHLNMILDRKLIFSVADRLSREEWIILENETGMALWTSDNPVTIDNTYSRELGLVSKGREIHFPLTPKLCLTSFDATTHKRPIINNIEFMNLLYHNVLQVRRSMRFVYSPEDDFSLARSFLKDYPSFRDPRLKRIHVY